MRYLIITLLHISILISACSPDNNEYERGGSDTAWLKENHDTSTEQNDLTDKNSINSIEAIREQYEKTIKAIGNHSTDSSSFSFDCNGEKIGKVTYHKLGGNIILIEKKYNELSHTDVSERYFVSNRVPYFIYHEIVNWAFDSNAEQGAVIDKYQEKRFYIINDEPVRCLEKRYTIRSASKEIPDPDKVPNKTVDCPPMQDLSEEFEVVWAKKDQVAPIDCFSSL